MSIETPESPSRSLVVRIPRPSSTSSTDSPLASSPSTSILTFPNASTSSSSSSAGTPPTATLSVKFAPLPDLSKRKKKYHHPLGVSARSDIMRRRRAAAEGNDYSYRDMANNSTDQQQQQQPSAPAWSEEDAKVEERYRGRHRSSRRRNVMGDEEDELLEDPLITLGRMVKGASKSLWRKVANKRGDAVGGSEGDSEGGKVTADGEDIPAGTVDDPLPAAPELNEATTIEAQRPRKQSSASAKGLRDRKQSSGSVVDIRLPPHPVSRKASLDSSM